MRFAWDEKKKNTINRRKHRVSFETATIVFDDPNQLLIFDRVVDGVLLLLVVHTMEEEDGKELFASSQHEELNHMKGDSTMTRYERIPGTPLTPEQRKEIEALRNMPDSEIDFSDAPVLPDSAWANAVRGRFYRPIKQPISLRLDADIIAWLKKDGEGYQTRANQMLRERMLKELGVS